eukprot:1611254-Amphidinium_carterae.1
MHLCPPRHCTSDAHHHASADQQGWQQCLAGEALKQGVTARTSNTPQRIRHKSPGFDSSRNAKSR